LFYVLVNLNGRGEAPTFHLVASPVVAAYSSSHQKEYCAGTKRDGGKRKDTPMRKFRDLESVNRDAWRLLGLGQPAVE